MPGDPEIGISTSTRRSGAMVPQPPPAGSTIHSAKQMNATLTLSLLLDLVTAAIRSDSQVSCSLVQIDWNSRPVYNFTNLLQQHSDTRYGTNCRPDAAGRLDCLDDGTGRRAWRALVALT